MTYRIECEPLPSSVRSARLFVVDHLQEWRCDDLVDRVALLTSELATNAVVHTGQPYTVFVARRGSTVRVEVVDRVEALPTLQDEVVLVDGEGAQDPVAMDQVAGDHVAQDHVAQELQGPAHDRTFSGLGIVAATATSWGSERLPGVGKIVWFELAGEGPEANPEAVSSGLRDLRESMPWISMEDGDEVSVDDWLVSLGGPRLPRVVRGALVVLGVLVLLVLAVLVRG